MNRLSACPLLVFVFLAPGCAGDEKKPDQKPALKVSAWTLATEYAPNHLVGVTDQKYLNKLIEVEGLICYLRRDHTGFHLGLLVGDDWSNIVCHFPPEPSAPLLALPTSGHIRQSHQVVLQGICYGRQADPSERVQGWRVVLDKCKLISAKPWSQ
jgi:hypothetical protein